MGLPFVASRAAAAVLDEGFQEGRGIVTGSDEVHLPIAHEAFAHAVGQEGE